MWSQSRRLGLETISRCTNVSSRSCLGQNSQRLGLGPMRLGSLLGLGAILPWDSKRKQVHLLRSRENRKKHKC